MANDAARRLILVLGMHRSGTSVITRALGALGAALGSRLLPALPCNPRGIFEDRRITTANNALLAAMGMRWYSLQPMPVAALRQTALSESGAEALTFLLELLESGPVCGLKDPRLCRLMAFWRPLLGNLSRGGVTVSCVLSVRHPDAVAASLKARDGMSRAHALRLWIQHELGALAGSAGLPRVAVSYDAVLERPEAELRRLGERLELPAEDSALRAFAEDFLDKDLCHGSAATDGDEEDAGAFELAQEIYECLLAAAADDMDLESTEATRLLGQWLEAERALPPLPAHLVYSIADVKTKCQ